MYGGENEIKDLLTVIFQSEIATFILKDNV